MTNFDEADYRQLPLGNMPERQTLFALDTPELIQALREGADPNEAVDTGLTVLHSFAGDPEAVAALLGAGADPNAVSGLMKQTPIFATRNAKSVELLAAAGADVNFTDIEGRTALHHAVSGDKRSASKLIDALLDAGADINARDGRQQTPLHTAGAWDRHALVDKLIDAGADLNAQDNTGMTPMHIAAGNGHTKTGIALLAHNPDLSLTTDTEANAQDYAYAASDEALVTAIRSHLAERERKQLDANTAPALGAWSPAPRLISEADEILEVDEEPVLRQRPMRL